MKQLIAIILALPLVCSVAFGATYKVSPTGDGSDGSTWTKAYQTISAAVAARHANGTVYEIDGGILGVTYTESINAEWGTTLTFRKSAESGHNGTVVVIGTSSMSTFNTDGGSIIEDITIINMNGASGRYAVRAKNSTYNRCIIGPANPDRAANPDIRNIILIGTGADTLTFNKCIIRGSGTARNVAINSSNIVVMNYCFISNNYGTIYNSGNLTTSNCNIVGNGFTNYVIENQVGSTYTSNNDIIAGNNLNDYNIDIIKNVGTVTYNNSLLLPHPLRPASYAYGLATQNSTVKNSPRFKSGRRGGYASIIVDDGNSETINYFLQIAAQAEGHGVRAAIALSTPSTVTEQNWAALRAAVARGHEVVNHTYTHPNLTVSSGITITGPSDSTVDIVVDNSDTDPSLWTGTIDCKVAGSSVGTVDISANGSYPTPTLAAARINALLGGAGWSAVATASGGINSLAAALQGNTATIATGGGAVFSWNYEKYLYYEVGWSKKYIEQKLSEGGSPYECKMFAYPGGAYNATIKGYMDDATTYPAGINQHIGARSLGLTKSWTLSSDLTSGTGSLSGLQVWEIYALHPRELTGASPTNALISERWAAWAEWLKFIGGVGMIYLHIESTDGANYYNPGLVGQIIGTLVHGGLTIQTPTQIVNNIRTSGLWDDIDANGTRWVRVYAEDNSDFHLLPGSPCINKGTPVGLTSDFAGRPVGSLPDIGAYEFFSNNGGGNFGSMNFSLGW